jgi:hypothetical protein
MGITLDAVTLQPIRTAQPAAPPVAPPLVVVAEPARGQARESKNERGKDQAPSFRAVLNATVAGGIQAQAAQTETAKPEPQARPARVPKSEPAELNGGESSVLLDAAYARRGEGASAARVHLAATSRYAQAFFADTRTFARPGESLELTV